MYDMSVITAFAILVVTVTYVAVGPVPENQSNIIGQASNSFDSLVCVKNDYGNIVCASVSKTVDADNKIFSNCLSEYGCTLSCGELTDACADSGSSSACELQNKFC